MADTTPGEPESPSQPPAGPEEDRAETPADLPTGDAHRIEDAEAPDPFGATGDTPSPHDLIWRIPDDQSGAEADQYPDAVAETVAPVQRETDPAHRKPGIWRAAALALASGLLGAALASAAVWWIVHDDGDGQPAAVTVVERVETQIVEPAAGEGIATAVARRVLPSIVTVEIASTASGDFVVDGSGSGVVLTADGLLVTNEHVVEGASQVRVVFADGRIYRADVVGQDPLSDLALLRIAASGLTPVEIGSADAMHIGDTAIALGSPLGLGGGPSVTVGVISAFDRRVQTGFDDELFGMLQTDAPITRGSSGGALVDAGGRLIGITTAIGISDVGAEGLGFAIPVEMVNRITEDLLDDGIVSHAFLGIQGTTFFEGAPDGATVPAGVAIASVVAGTAAELAGLEPGDLIRSVDGVRVTTMEQLVVRIRLYRVGDTVELITDRGEETLTISMTLMERPEGV